MKCESAGVEAREMVIILARARVKPAIRKVMGCAAAAEGDGRRAKGGRGQQDKQIEVIVNI